MITNLIVALICGFLVSIIYRISYQGPNFSPTFVQSSILLSMITALVIMVIGNNLARAFGLVGAMSIIRFRTAIKDTQDIVFIFFSLAVGMAAGVGLRLAALIGTVFIGLILVGLSTFNYAAPRKKEFLIQFHYDDSINGAEYLNLLRKYCKKHRMVNMQSLGQEDIFEISFFIELKSKDQSNTLIRELNKLDSVSDIHFFFDEDPL